jgi:thioredoxin reductase (NADPH)
MEKLIIIGCGAAGLTAAIYAARANLEPVVITGSLPGGLLTQTTDVENYPGFPEAVNGFELMFKFQQQAERFGTRMVNDTVTNAELIDGGPHKLTLGSGEVIETKALIIATGASPRWLGLESEDRLKNHGVSACATCDGAFYRDVPVVVIGGGDTAMEEADFLTKFASKVTVIHRRDELRASKIMAERALANDKIEFCWDSTVEEVLGKDSVEGIRIKNLKTGDTTVIDCEGYFAALGHVPSTQIFAGVIDMDDKGFIILKNGSSYTNIAGVFGAGDCADAVYRQAITASGMGCKAAIDAERWLAE